MATKKTNKTEKEIKLWVNGLKDRIIFARSSSSISQMKLAENLDIHVTTLNKYERGKRVPDAETLNRIAEETGCPPGWLLSGDGAIERKGDNTGADADTTAKYISLLEQNVKKLEQENEELKAYINKSSTKPKTTKKK
jgi:transcriptional regulator with XRE-family HTH domain